MESLWKNLIRHRGFAIPSHDIYGCNGGLWDFGPLGYLMKKRISKLWWKSLKRAFSADLPVLPVETSLLVAQPLLQASGHMDNFFDLSIDCVLTGARVRVDRLKTFEFKPQKDIEGRIRFKIKEYSDFVKGTPSNINIPKLLEHCPWFESLEIVEANPKTHTVTFDAVVSSESLKSLKAVALTNSPFLGNEKSQNLMFGFDHQGANCKTSLFLRPETTQGVMAQYKELKKACQLNTPFILGQEGRAFRNEIDCQPMLVRSREFDQLEAFLFCDSLEEAMSYHQQLTKHRFEWWKSLGVEDKDVFRCQEQTSLAHYALSTSDIECLMPWGWTEIEGISNRGQFDLKNHFPDLEESNTPFVVESSMGLSRSLPILIYNAHRQRDTGDKGKGEYLSLDPRISPYTVAIFPLVQSDERILQTAKNLFSEAQDHPILEESVFFDSKRTIGKRYVSQDQIGTPFCVTVDSQTIKDATVTIRERDSRLQMRVPMQETISLIANFISKRENFSDLMKSTINNKTEIN